MKRTVLRFLLFASLMASGLCCARLPRMVPAHAGWDPGYNDCFSNPAYPAREERIAGLERLLRKRLGDDRFWELTGVLTQEAAGAEIVVVAELLTFGEGTTVTYWWAVLLEKNGRFHGYAPEPGDAVPALDETGPAPPETDPLVWGRLTIQEHAQALMQRIRDDRLLDNERSTLLWPAEDVPYWFGEGGGWLLYVYDRRAGRSLAIILNCPALNGNVIQGYVDLSDVRRHGAPRSWRGDGEARPVSQQERRRAEEHFARTYAGRLVIEGLLRALRAEQKTRLGQNGDPGTGRRCESQIAPSAH